MKSREHLLGHYPTPLVPLVRLSRALGGPEIWMKRDDLTGLALGGNKTRKLERLIADAIHQGADTVITAGAQQSNHCRQTAAACAATGLQCHLVLGGSRPEQPNGNLLLDTLFGATIHFTGDERKGESLAEIAKMLESSGRRPYIIPYGGSNEIGARAFVDAIAEVKLQLDERKFAPTRIVFASSSGGTQAGMIVGSAAHHLHCEITGISIDKDAANETPFAERIAEIANRTAGDCPVWGKLEASEVVLKEGYTGAGYGVVGDLEREAISLTASLEGILLDPVYTGRAMGALIDMIRRGEIAANERIVFWHTGGAPALFPYAGELTSHATKPIL